MSTLFPQESYDCVTLHKISAALMAGNSCTKYINSRKKRRTSDCDYCKTNKVNILDSPSSLSSLSGSTKGKSHNGKTSRAPSFSAHASRAPSPLSLL